MEEAVEEISEDDLEGVAGGVLMGEAAARYTMPVA